MRFSTFIVPLLGLVTPIWAAKSTVSTTHTDDTGVLYTDSVTYCAEAKAVLIDNFDIAYHQSNQSVTFAFSFASVESNLNTSANLYINAYGIQILNQTLDLCSLLQGVICPLPQVNFSGFGTYPIPSEYVSKLPNIAFTVPNLEAYARVQLIREEDGEVAACLQATLANGKTTKLKAVAIASGIFALVALLIGLVHTTLETSPSPSQYRWFDVLYLFQTAAAAGLLHLNYPLVFSNFAGNFAWSMGLFHSSPMQNSINVMRNKTGGHLDGNAYSDVQYINRKLSPYNLAAVDTNQFETISQFSNFVSELPRLSARQLQKRVSIPSALYSNATSDLDTGLPVYVNSLNIPQANAFTTVFFFFLAFIGIALVFHLLLYPVVLVARRSKYQEGWGGRFSRIWPYFCMGNALRVCLIWFLPVFIFGFYQWKIGDSKLAIFFAVLAILLVLVPLAVAFVLSVLRTRHPSTSAPTVSPLYTSFRWFHSVGVLYRAYRQKFHFFWFAPLVLAMIARAGFIAFGNSRAWAQVIGNLVVEFLVFIFLVALRPHKDRKGDWLSPILSLIRLVIFGLLIAFIPSLSVKGLVRAIIGFVEIAVIGLTTVLLFFGMIWNAGYGYLWRRHTYRVEDGHEVERFVADGDSQTKPAMAQTDGTDIFGRTNTADTSPPARGRNSVLEPLNQPYTSDRPSDVSAAAYQDAAEGRHSASYDYNPNVTPATNRYSRASSNDRNSGPYDGYYQTPNFSEKAPMSPTSLRSPTSPISPSYRRH